MSRKRLHALLHRILNENREVIQNQTRTTKALASTVKRLGKSLRVIANLTKPDERPADTKVLNSVTLDGITARDLVNFCQSWLRISKDKVRYEARYDSFRTKLQGKGFDGQFDSIFTETVENAGGRASSELLDMAIKLLVEVNKPTPTQAHDAFEELYFQPRKESGHQFYIKFDEYARRAIDGRPEAYQKAHLATLGKTLRSKVLKGLKEDGNEQKISEFELRFSNPRTEQDSTQSVAAIVKELFPSFPTLTPWA